MKAQNLYQCSICKLHYSDKKFAEACHAWCAKHESCNVEITKNSKERIEYLKSKNL